MIGTPKGRHGLFYDSYQDASLHDDWFRACYKASETGILPEEELDAAKRTMSEGEYQQEFECDWSAAIRGAYWGEVMLELEKEGRITKIPHQERDLVYTSWDLGISDATAIWFFQPSGGEWNFVDYMEFTNMGIPAIVRELRALPYDYGPCIVPHDIKVRSLATGISRRDTLEQLGFELVMANYDEPVPVQEAIDIARSKLKVCNFDEERCRHGIECLRQYCAEWDEIKGTLRQRPRHDWTSHGADAFRYFAITEPNYLVGKWAEEPDYTLMDQAIL